MTIPGGAVKLKREDDVVRVADLTYAKRNPKMILPFHLHHKL